jgi:hypothetical protein
MTELQGTGFAERLTAAADAKRAMLAKFKPKAAVAAPLPIDRAALRAAELEQVRNDRAAAKEAKRQALADAAAAARVAEEQIAAAALDASRLPSSEKGVGKRRALNTQSADAARSVGIIVSDRAESGGIDRFGGGTRPTALPCRWGRCRLLPMAAAISGDQRDESPRRESRSEGREWGDAVEKGR